MQLFIKYLNFVFLLMVCFACSSNSQNALRMNLGAEPHTLDPRKARDLQSMTITKMFFEGLSRVNRDEVAECALANKVDISEDGKIYIFHLREAVWNTGSKVTAHDFVYAWSTVLDPHFPADQAFQLYVIKNGKACKDGRVIFEQVGVKALDDQTLQVELEHPIPYFLELTALPVYFPVSQKVDEAHPHWATSAQTLVGNGPFTIKEWKHNDHIHAVKSLNYWDASNVKLKEIDFVMVDEPTELQMYEKGELDWAGSPLSTLPCVALKNLKKQGQLQVKPFLATYFFRTNIESSPFQHPLMRKAFALALHRSELIEHVTQGQQLPATGLIPPVMGVQQQPYFKDGDQEAAKELFKEALIAEGFTLETLPTVTLLYSAGERNHLIAQTVQQQWRAALGITVELQAVERKVFYDRISKKNFQLAVGSWTADFGDSMNFLEIFKFRASGSNNTGWENLKYRQLLDEALEVHNIEERQKIFQECESILMQEMPIIPLFHYTLLYVSNQNVKGVVLSQLGGLDFKWAYKLVQDGVGI
jgi:oligopeptide transport system substrate-binding protein